MENNYFRVRKISSRWVPDRLTDLQKMYCHTQAVIHLNIYPNDGYSNNSNAILIE